MRVIPPLAITDAILFSSTAAEPHAPAAYNPATTYAAGAIVSVAADFTIYQSLVGSNTGHTPSTSPTWWEILGPTETAYNGATTYGLGDTVSSATTHRVYESLQAGNVGNALPVPPETATAWWLDVGPTNRWAMFDLLRNTQTVNASPLTVVLIPGKRVDSVALLGLEATSVTVSMVSGGPTVYTATENLNNREIADWYEYFFEPFSTQPSMVKFDLPPYSNGVITVAITNTGGNAVCGALAAGSFQEIGDIQTNAESNVLNFSTIDRDVFGNAILVPRRSIPKTNQTVVCDSGIVDAVRNLRTALNAVPAVWVGLNEPTEGYYESFLILGIYREFTIGAVHHNKAVISLSLEEI